MQPRTKLEKRVASLSPSLTPFTPSMMSHALKVLPSNGKYSSYYYGAATTCKEFQVMRHFIVNPKRKTSVEVSQSWIAPDGTITIMARRCFPAPYIYDCWDYSSPLSIKHMGYSCSQSYYHTSKRYFACDYAVYCRPHFTSTLKRNGLDGMVDDFEQFCSLLLTDSHFETIVKAGNKDMINYYLQNPAKEYMWDAYRTTLRAGYTIKDFSLWKDMIDDIFTLDGDLCNRAIVCPSNLNSAHDVWMKRVVAYRRRQQLERDREMLEKERERTKTYKKRLAAYLGIMLSDTNLVIRPLQSVDEFYEEGEAMHHCVFSNKYYNKEDCLILSARDAEGHRLATIELQLSANPHIVQCRAACNQVPDRDEEIRSLITSNLALFCTQRAAA